MTRNCISKDVFSQVVTVSLLRITFRSGLALASLRSSSREGRVRIRHYTVQLASGCLAGHSAKSP